MPCNLPWRRTAIVLERCQDPGAGATYCAGFPVGWDDLSDRSGVRYGDAFQDPHRPFHPFRQTVLAGVDVLSGLHQQHATGKPARDALSGALPERSGSQPERTG